jgi:hypothetical protein
MKTQEEVDAALLEGMPRANKGRVVRKKRFVTSKHLPLDIAVRREVAEEIGEAEPTRDQKYILLQKYGVVAPRIDRLVTKPRWMGEGEWKRKQNNWFKITQGSASQVSAEIEETATAASVEDVGGRSGSRTLRPSRDIRSVTRKAHARATRTDSARAQAR